MGSIFDSIGVDVEVYLTLEKDLFLPDASKRQSFEFVGSTGR
jgi:hypothetical protein